MTVDLATISHELGLLHARSAKRDAAEPAMRESLAAFRPLARADPDTFTISAELVACADAHDGGRPTADRRRTWRRTPASGTMAHMGSMDDQPAEWEYYSLPGIWAYGVLGVLLILGGATGSLLSSDVRWLEVGAPCGLVLVATALNLARRRYVGARFTLDAISVPNKDGVSRTEWEHTYRKWPLKRIPRR